MRVRKDALALLNHSERMHVTCPYCMADEGHIHTTSGTWPAIVADERFVAGVRLCCTVCRSEYTVGWATNGGDQRGLRIIVKPSTAS